MLDKLKSLINPLLDIIYPNLCIACDRENPLEYSCFCISCLDELPFTNFHDERDNIVEKFFWGRLIIEKGTALFYFHKGELVQEMIHRLKYKNQSFIGTSLGLEFGKQLLESDFMNEIDVIIPIPIHKSKRSIRNYNQSSLIAKEISKISGVPWTEDIIIKSKKSSSQTDKTRDERLDNLKETFDVKNKEVIEGKHVLIIDDILTTGATLEAVGSLISQCNSKVSVAVIAVGKY